jgi:bacillopeptidase F
MARRRVRKYSRLSRRENKRYVRQSALLTILTLFLLFALVFWGIPALVKLAIFLSDLHSSTQPISGKDTVPPAPPVIQPVPEATSSGSIRIEGFAEESSNVVLSINNVDSYETLVESDGEFLFDKVILKPGENQIKARAIDAAGNESRSSSVINLLYDSNPPTLVVDSPSEGTSFFGSSEQSIIVSGSAEPGASVRVNGSFVILSHEGKFNYRLTLNLGENSLTIVARDKAGNETVESRTVTYEE